MHYSMKMNPAPRRPWKLAAAIRLIGMASLLLPALCQAQTPPVYTISTIVGTGTAGYTGDLGPATLADISGPSSVVVDSKGNLYISDQVNDVIRKVTSGTITTIAGIALPGYTGDGAAAVTAELNTPDSVFVDSK